MTRSSALLHRGSPEDFLTLQAIVLDLNLLTPFARDKLLLAWVASVLYSKRRCKSELSLRNVRPTSFFPVAFHCLPLSVCLSLKGQKVWPRSSPSNFPLEEKSIALVFRTHCSCLTFDLFDHFRNCCESGVHLTEVKCFFKASSLKQHCRVVSMFHVGKQQQDISKQEMWLLDKRVISSGNLNFQYTPTVTIFLSARPLPSMISAVPTVKFFMQGTHRETITTE